MGTTTKTGEAFILTEGAENSVVTIYSDSRNCDTNSPVTAMNTTPISQDEKQNTTRDSGVRDIFCPHLTI